MQLKTRAQNINIINSLKVLKKDWDGNNALPIAPKVISIIKLVVKNIERQPNIFPTTYGNILLVYDSGEDTLELEFYTNSLIRVIAVINDKEVEQWYDIFLNTSSNIQFKDINRIVKKFYKKRDPKFLNRLLCRVKIRNLFRS